MATGGLGVPNDLFGQSLWAHFATSVLTAREFRCVFGGLVLWIDAQKSSGLPIRRTLHWHTRRTQGEEEGGTNPTSKAATWAAIRQIVDRDDG